MTADSSPAPAEPARRTQSFQRHSNVPRMTFEQKRRQSDVLGCAWRHFGAAAPAIAFLNTRHRELKGQPLQLALRSDEGLLQVERLLATMTLES